jgi:hypothetical protein
VLVEVSYGATFEQIELSEIELPNPETLTALAQPRRKLIKQIENLKISADAKALLFTMTDTVIKFGEVLLPLGRAVLGAALELLKIFPTLSLAVILAKFLPLLLPAWIVKIKLAALISKILPFLGGYIDIKDNILNDNFGKAARKIAQKFYPKNKDTALA